MAEIHPTSAGLVRREIAPDEKKVTDQVTPGPSAAISEQTSGQSTWRHRVERVFGVQKIGNRGTYASTVRARARQDPTTAWGKFMRFFAFLGPGAIISVAYVDPDNYQTAISSGSTFQYKLLFMILVSNIVAIYLQALCVKLESVTGKDLAQLNHEHLPRWLELFIYAIAEACIICTDLGQVIGTAFALNILIPRLPLPAAIVLSVAETLLILLFYTRNGELRRIRMFEIFISLLVLAIFITTCIVLAMIEAPIGQVFRGYVPSREIFVGDGLYDSCAILGGTLMPHAIYIGTALSRTRLLDYDEKHELAVDSDTSSANSTYRPSLRAIKSCLAYSIAEMCSVIFVVAVFVNSALIIIAGSSFYQTDDNGGGMRRRDDDGGGSSSSNSTTTTGTATGSNDNSDSDDLYSLYNLFSTTLGPGAGILFAISLLFSGISAGIVATMAGQVIMEGAFKMRINPFVRRLLTRCVAIIPALIIALAVGRDGLSRALVGCNYVLSIGLIFVSFPLVFFTGRDKYMRVPTDDNTGSVSMRNNIATAVVAWLIWALVVFMDVATIVLIGLGVEEDD